MVSITMTMLMIILNISAAATKRGEPLPQSADGDALGGRRLLGRAVRVVQRGQLGVPLCEPRLRQRDAAPRAVASLAAARAATVDALRRELHRRIAGSRDVAGLALE